MGAREPRTLIRSCLSCRHRRDCQHHENPFPYLCRVLFVSLVQTVTTKYSWACPSLRTETLCSIPVEDGALIQHLYPITARHSRVKANKVPALMQRDNSPTLVRRFLAVRLELITRFTLVWSRRRVAISISSVLGSVGLFGKGLFSVLARRRREGT